MNRNDFFYLFVAGLIALALFWLFSGGCASSHETSPVSSWSPAYDAAWNDVTTCWGKRLVKPTVIVRQDCVARKDGVQHFSMGTVGSQERWATGQAYASTVEVCPDLAALRHEFSHYVSGVSAHDGRCWL